MKQELERNYSFDNIKAILVFWVVLAHYIRVGATFHVESISGVLYITAFSFIMQGFLFVSGYFSRNVEKCRKTAFQTFLFPYFILMPIMSVYRYFIFGHAQLNYFFPSMALWYLINMFVYRYFIKDLVKIKFILPISMIASFLAGMIPFLNETLSIGRIFSFLPFYLLGYFCSREQIEKIQNLPKSIGFLLLSALVGFSIIMSYDKIDIETWQLKAPFFELGLGNLEGIGYRVLFFIVALGWIITLLILSPKKKTWLVPIGQNTMSVYILHIFIRYFLKATHLLDGQGIWMYVSLILSTFISVWLFSRPIVAKAYDKGVHTLYFGFIYLVNSSRSYFQRKPNLKSILWNKKLNLFR